MDRVMNGLLEAAKIAAGYVPTDADLAGAPIIDVWGVVMADGLPALVGRVSGHPLLADGKRIVTSPLLAVDLDRAWARTVSRYYRLGRQCGESAQ